MTSRTHRWYESHDNLVALTAYLADKGFDGLFVAYAVEKPWKYEREWIEMHDGDPDRPQDWSDAELSALGAAETAAEAPEHGIRRVGT